jgi:hypothetical protein
MHTVKKIYSPDLLNQWISGTIFDLYSNCNSKFRELRLAKERNDRESVIYWEKRIEQCSYLKNLLFKWFYIRENQIETETDFNNFMELFKRLAEIKTKKTWFELATEGPNKN